MELQHVFDFSIRFNLCGKGRAGIGGFRRLGRASPSSRNRAGSPSERRMACTRETLWLMYRPVLDRVITPLLPLRVSSTGG